MKRLPMSSAKACAAIIFYAIFCMGILMVYSTTAADLLEKGSEDLFSWHFVKKQVVYGVIALSIGVIVYKVGYQRWLWMTPYLLCVISICLLLVLIPGVGSEINGARRWLSVFGFSFQPSELLKVILPSYILAKGIGIERGNFFAWLRLLALPFVSIALVLLEPNNGTAMLLLTILFFTVWLIGIPLKYLSIPLAIASVVVAISLIMSPYVRSRMEVFWNPEKDLLGRGHQPYQAKIAVGSGGLFGAGPGNSMQKYSYLPESQNDYIVAVFAEEFGFSGAALLIALWMAGGTALALLCFNCLETRAFYLTVILTIALLLQAFLNLAVVTGLFPSTGLTLPFFSQGGTSLLASTLSLALILACQQGQLSRSTNLSLRSSLERFKLSFSAIVS